MYAVRIFVYCSQKTGSQTLLNTFEKNNYIVRHLHGDNQYFNKKYGMYWQNFLKEKNTIWEWIDYSIKNNNDNIVYIIDSYRDPIERLISLFFQAEIYKIKDYDKLSIQYLIDYFNNNLLYKLPRVDAIDEVFDYYKKENFKSFDFNNKYNICKFDNKIIIKLRYRDINEWSNILSKIFGKNIELYNENITKDKDPKIYNLYKNFKLKYKVPKKFLEEEVLNNYSFNIYNNENDKIFYKKYWYNNCY